MPKLLLSYTACSTLHTVCATAPFSCLSFYLGHARKNTINLTGIPKGATSSQKLVQHCVTPESASIPQQRSLPVKTLAESENPGKNSEN